MPRYRQRRHRAGTPGGAQLGAAAAAMGGLRCVPPQHQINGETHKLPRWDGPKRKATEVSNLTRLPQG